METLQTDGDNKNNYDLNCNDLIRRRVIGQIIWHSNAIFTYIKCKVKFKIDLLS